MHRSPRSNRPSSRHSLTRRRRKFSLEQLEHRQMMAAMLYDASWEFAGSQDYEFVQVGGFKAGGGGAAGPTDGIVPASDPETFSIPALSSHPGAPVALFLDFDGHFQSGGVIGGKEFVTTPRFSFDDNPFRMSEKEQKDIQHIWATVAEDFAPFNINVTTVDPSGQLPAAKIMRVAIGGVDFVEGENARGRARLNVFSNDSPNVVYVFPLDKETVFSNGLHKPRTAHELGGAVSHEVGHAFGLEHQSRWGVAGFSPVEERHGGDGPVGMPSVRAPIMGNHTNGQRAVWWTGLDHLGRIQNDMATLARDANGFGYRWDDHANGLWALRR